MNETNDVKHNALCRAIRLAYNSGNHLYVEIVRDIVSCINHKEDLDTKIRAYPYDSHDYSPLEFALNEFCFPKQLKAAEILLNAGADPNSVDNKRINNLLKGEMRYNIGFFIFFLAKGLRLDKEGKEILGRDSILSFFVRSGVDFDSFFQNVKNDTELIDGLIKIKKCTSSKAQELAFSAWLEFGIEEKSTDTITRFLKHNTEKNLILVASRLRRYLEKDDVRNLFLALLSPSKSFLDEHKKEVVDLLITPIIDGLNFDNISEKRRRKSRARNRYLISFESEKSLCDIRHLYKEELKESKNEKQVSHIYAPIACVLIALVITHYFLLCSIAVTITAGIIGVAIGYGIGKVYEKVSAEKSQNPSMSTWTAITNVLTPECARSKSQACGP